MSRSAERAQPLVLHVDDNEASRYTVGRVLRAAGMDVLSASTATEGLRLAAERRPDLVLLDVKLPDMGGFEACRRLRADPVTRRVPVLHLSATYLGPEYVTQGLEGGADGYLTQPVEASVLVATIRALLRAYRAEAETRAWRDRYEAAILASGKILYEQDLVTDELVFGGSCERILGYSLEEMPHHPDEWCERIHPEDRAAFAEVVEEVRRAPRHYCIEYRVRRKDGCYVDLEHYAYPVTDETGSVERMVGFVEDITERKRRDQELKRQALTFENMSDSVILTDVEGRILDWNPASERVFGYTREEAIGQDISMLQRPEDAERLRRQVVAEITDGGRWSGLATFVRKDGREGLCEAVALPVWGAKGFTTACLIVSRDATERTRLEEQLRQSQKLEAVGRLAGGVSHDFNNLLTVICGYSELLLDRMVTEDPLRADVEEISRAASRAAGLVRQLLAFSRRQVLQPRGLDLSSTVANVVPMLKRLLGSSIELTTDIEPGLGEVRANPIQMEQVIINLALNARDAMLQGGKLTIAARDVDLSEPEASQRLGMAPGPYVVLTVSDTGCGMDAETRSHIFEPFFTTKGRAKSTGLGLSTVHGIVRQSGGGIEVESEVGRGSTFRVYLPRLAARTGGASRSPVDGWAPLEGRTILVAEDEEVVRVLVRDLLTTGGHQVLEAHNGTEALALCARHPGAVDLLVTDMIMPDMNGRELAHRLLDLRPGLRVLYMSGYTEVTMVHHGMLEPGTPFLQKPFTPDELVAKVQETLQRSHSGPDGVPFLERLAG